METDERSRVLTVGELVERLRKVPQSLELWRCESVYAKRERVGVREVPIYLNAWPDEQPCWEFTEATQPGRCIKTQRVAIFIDPGDGNE